MGDQEPRKSVAKPRSKQVPKIPRTKTKPNITKNRTKLCKCFYPMHCSAVMHTILVTTQPHSDRITIETHIEFGFIFGTLRRGFGSIKFPLVLLIIDPWAKPFKIPQRKVVKIFKIR